MKKLLLLFCALLCLGGSRAWAVEVNIVNQSTGANGTFTTANYVFQSNAASGLAGVQISSPNSDIQIGCQDVSSYGGYCFKYQTPVNLTDYTIRLSAPSGYKIISCYMRLRSNQGAYPIKVTYSPTSYTKTSSTSGVDFNLTGIESQTIDLTFQCTTNDAETNKIVFVPSFVITLKADAAADVSVVYKEVFNGSVVSTKDAVTQYIGDAPALPLNKRTPYCTYQYYSDEACTEALTELTNSSTLVYAKSTFSPPFTVSSGFDGATWYYLSLRNKSKYVLTSSTNIPYPNATSKPSVSEALWAFSGDPYNGIKVMNARAGDGKFLKMVSAENGSAVTIQDGGQTWAIGVGNNGFYLKDPGNNNLFIHDLGSTLAIWNNSGAQTDNGSGFQVEAASPVKVTYKLTYEGDVISSYTKDLYELVGATAAAPLDWVLPAYCSLGSCSPATITAETTEVTIPLIWDGPFDFSTDFASAKWYYMQIGGKYVVSNAETNCPAYAAKQVKETGLWAFVGNPYDGFYIINYASGEGKRLGIASTCTMGNPGSYNIIQIKKVGDVCLMYNDPANPFFLFVDPDNYIKGGYEYETYGSALFTPVNWGELANAKIDEYYDSHAPGEYLGTSTELVISTKASITAMGASFTKTLYESLDMDGLIKYPSTGYYRIKSSGSREAGAGYITYGEVYPTYGNSLIVNPSALNDPASIIHFTKVSDGVYTLSLQGLNVQAASESNKVLANMNEAVNFTIAQAAPGFASIGSGEGRNYFHEAGWTTSGYSYNPVVGWDAPSSASDASAWIVEDVEEISVTLNSDGAGTPTYYATFCAPFSYTVSGATAYTLAASGNWLVPTPIDGEVAAGTPVLLKSTTGNTATLTIGTGYAATPLTTTSLTGTYTATGITGSEDYVLGIDGGVVGFYHWNQNTLGANRAYLDAPAASGVKGFAINWDLTDGIDATQVENGQRTKDAAIYNIAGQRLSQPQRGVNIINGKKVIVK